MKKNRKVVLISIIVLGLMLVACGNDTVVQSGGQNYFDAMIVDLSDEAILVSCTNPIETNFEEGDNISLTKSIVPSDKIPKVEVGDIIRVVCAEKVLEEGIEIQSVFSIYLVADDGSIIDN